MGTIRCRLAPILVLAALVLGVVVNAQPEAAGEAIRLLIVDETRTFLSTMRVGGIVGMIKGSGIFQVDVILANVESSWNDPLAGEEPGSDLEPYDLALIIPRGIDDGSIDWACILSGAPRLLSAHVSSGIDLITQVVGQVFEGSVRPIGVHDDLLLGFLYEVYVMEGWMR
jgi:hypothetical protein